jgi:hypothetical protein
MMGGVRFSLATHHATARRTGERSAHACWEDSFTIHRAKKRGMEMGEVPSQFNSVMQLAVASAGWATRLVLPTFPPGLSIKLLDYHRMTLHHFALIEK